MKYKVGQKVTVRKRENIDVRDGSVDGIGIISQMLGMCGQSFYIEYVKDNPYKKGKKYFNFKDVDFGWPEGMVEPAYVFPEPFYEKCLVKFDGVDLAVITTVKDGTPECFVIAPEDKAGVQAVPWESLHLIEEEKNENFEFLFES